MSNVYCVTNQDGDSGCIVADDVQHASKLFALNNEDGDELMSITFVAELWAGSVKR